MPQFTDHDSTRVRGAGAYRDPPKGVTVANRVEDRTAIDELPKPGNPLDVDGSGMDGLDRMLRCVAVSAITLRDAGYPEQTAFELVLAAKHIKRCMCGVDQARTLGTIQPSPVTGLGRTKWSRSLQQARCCAMTLGGTRTSIEAP